MLLEQRMEQPEFIIENRKLVKGTYTKVDISPRKLREQYKYMKQTWTELSSQPKTKSGTTRRKLGITC